MERKLWFKIFALLLLALSALASHDNETSSLSTVALATPAGPSLALAPVAPTAGPESESSLDGQVHVSNKNIETSPSSPLNGTTKEEPSPLVPLDTSNGTTVTNSSEILYINGTVPENATSIPASENQTSAAQSQLTPTSTTLSSPNKTETLPVPPPTTPSHLGFANTSQTDAFIHVVTSAPTTKVTLSATTPATTSTTTTVATSTTTASSSSTAQEIRATTHHRAITPSQLNVGEDTTAVHEAPALDPLLAGLVSAFIIAAVIITLLLFLKLRRRDTRPEFRRLQDLPMDDMMEDTPLSMYSY